MLSVLRPAASLLALFTVLTGIIYPMVVTGVAQIIFPTQANGSLIEASGRVMGSRLVGQPFDDARYFWGRPSATVPGPYNAAASTGSNLGPSSPALLASVRGRVTALRAAYAGTATVAIPVDLVTASGSGLDPHVSPAAALYQVHRVAAARGLAPERVESLVLEHIDGRSFGLLGEPRVNVVLLNVALDGLVRGAAPRYERAGEQKLHR